MKIKEIIRLIRGLFEKFDPDDYVWIERDGTARELTEEDIEMFIGKNGSGDMPYVKIRYDKTGVDTGFAGFLEKRDLPGNVPIEKVDPKARLQEDCE